MISEEMTVIINKENKDDFEKEFNDLAMEQLCWKQPLFGFGEMSDDGLFVGEYINPDWTFDYGAGEETNELICDFVKQFCASHPDVNLRFMFITRHGSCGQISISTIDYKNKKMKMVEKGGTDPKLMEKYCEECDKEFEYADFEPQFNLMTDVVDVIRCPQCNSIMHTNLMSLYKEKKYSFNELKNLKNIYKDTFIIKELENDEIMIESYCGDNEAVIIPESINGKRVRGLRSMLFSPCAVKKTSEKNKRNSIKTINILGDVYIVDDYELQFKCGLDEKSIIWGCDGIKKLTAPASILYHDMGIYKDVVYSTENMKKYEMIPQIKNNRKKLIKQLAAIKNCEIGSEVEFGQRREWIKLAEKNNKSLLITKEIVCKAYFDCYKEVRWKKSSIRKYLNSFFLNNDFTNSELSAIEETKITGCRDVFDKVFLLSEKELNEYVIETDIIKKLDKESWFLRSKGEMDGSIAFYICEDEDEGISFDLVHEHYRRGVVHSVCGIRPAIWVRHDV